MRHHIKSNKDLFFVILMLYWKSLGISSEGILGQNGFGGSTQGECRVTGLDMVERNVLDS